jgi:hypothetical protein
MAEWTVRNDTFPPGTLSLWDSPQPLVKRVARVVFGVGAAARGRRMRTSLSPAIAGVPDADAEGGRRPRPGG